MLKVLIKNTGSNISIFALRIIIAFIMTPVLVRGLGNYDYGLWELVGTIIGYMGLLDVGIRPAASRFAALYNANKDHDSLLRLYATTLLFMGCIGIVLMFCMIFWAFYFPEYLAEDKTYYDKYFFFLIIIGVQLLSIFPGKIAESFLEGFQKYVLKNNISIPGMIITSTIVYSYITPDNALLLLATVNVIGIIIKYIIYFFLLGRPANGKLYFHVKYFSWATFSEVVQFGSKTLLQGIGTRLAAGANNVIIATILGPGVIVFYSIPASMAAYATTARMLLTHAFMPFFSDLYARDEKDSTKTWYLSASRVVAGLVYPLCIGLILLGVDFITLWLGYNYIENGKIILYVSCMAAMVHATNPFSNRYLTAINKHGYLVFMNFLDAFLLIILNIIFIRIFGIQGVVYGTLISAIIVFPFILRFVCQHLQIDTMLYIRKSIVPILLPNIIMGCTIVAIKQTVEIDRYFELFLIAVTGATVYMVCFFFFSLNEKEKTVIRKKISNLSMNRL